MATFSGILEDVEYEILTGAFRPRERLVEKEVMARFNINRNTVRKILKELQIKRLITHYPNRGAIVSELSEQEVRDIYALRMLLERHACDLVIKNITPQKLKEVKKISQQFNRAAKEKDFKRMVKANIEFHNTITKMCGNAALSEMIEQWRTRCHLISHSHWRQPGVIKKSIEEHQKILQALETRSAAELKSVNKKHTEVSLKSYLKRIEGFG